MAVRAFAPGELVRVRVAEGWAVYDGERQRHGGEVIEVPVEQAGEWLRNGWLDREVPTENEGR